MWVILRVRGRHSLRITEEVGGFRPEYRRWTKPARKKKPVISRVPLFSGWVFLEYTEEAYKKAMGVPGVYGAVKYGRRGPLLLTDDDMERIVAMQDMADQAPGQDEGDEDIRSRWSIGDEVQIELLGLTGRIIGFKGNDAQVEVRGIEHRFTVSYLLLRSPVI